VETPIGSERRVFRDRGPGAQGEKYTIFQTVMEGMNPGAAPRKPLYSFLSIDIVM
jgi:hypothetical protein